LAHSFDTAPSLAWALLVAADTRAAGGDFPGAWDAIGRAAELIEASPDAGRVAAMHEEVSARVASAEAGGAPPAVREISPAEIRVLRLLGDGMTRPEIAESLVISVNTVKTHQRRLYRKLGVGERDEALARARAHGLLD
jgi:LuxR family maltose regulon positive regulatory protein